MKENVNLLRESDFRFEQMYLCRSKQINKNIETKGDEYAGQ